MGRKLFQEIASLGGQILCLAKIPGMSLPASLSLSLCGEVLIPSSKPSRSLCQFCVACPTVCGCPAFEKPGDTRNRKCLAQQLPLRLLIEYESRVRVVNGFGYLPPGEEEAGWRGERPPSPELSDAGRGDPSESLPGLVQREHSFDR